MGALVTNSPPILYKYRGGDQVTDDGMTFTERDLRTLLANRQLYLATPAELNDPFDCRPSLEIDRSRLDRELQAIRATEGDELADLLSGRLALLEASWHKRDAFLAELVREDLSEFGVISLSSTRSSVPMWTHYANGFKGFAVGYKARDDEAGEALGAIGVDYRPDRTPIDWLSQLSGNSKSDYWLSLLYRKSMQWQHEEEWRYVRLPTDGGAGLMDVPENSICQVIAGYQMDSFHRAMLLTLAGELPDRPEVLEAYPCERTFEIKFSRLFDWDE